MKRHPPNWLNRLSCHIIGVIAYPLKGSFFSVNVLKRKLTLVVEQIDDLREAVHVVQKTPAFDINASVFLPDHMHTNYMHNRLDRWRTIKKGAFTQSIPKTECRFEIRIKRHEQGILFLTGRHIDLMLQGQLCELIEIRFHLFFTGKTNLPVISSR